MRVISLKKQLIVWMLGLFSVFGVLASGASYLFAREDAGTILDRQLLLIAYSIDEGSRLPAMQAAFMDERKEDYQIDFVIQVWYKNEMLRSSRPDFDLSKNSVPGYSNTVIGGEAWRVYTLIDSERTVQVSQPEQARRNIAIRAALRNLFFIVCLFPLTWLLVVFGVGRILFPIVAVTKAAAQRDALSLSPLPMDNVPQEIAPLVREMNYLIARIGDAVESQRNFVLDAAHELRTPLTALQLQIENLSNSHSDVDLGERIRALKAGIERASHLVVQLLHMARYGVEKRANRTSADTDLGALVKSCIADFVPVAEKRNIDLGMVKDESASIYASADDLRILFNNLLDNAIRYTPDGGRVDVGITVDSAAVMVTIMDDGSGIPGELLPRVFDRFFRAGSKVTQGSGIGLSIVHAIAHQESATVNLSNRQDCSGLIATVKFNLSN